MNDNPSARYDEYLAVLDKSRVYRKAFDKTCEVFFQQNGKQMKMENKLYLMVFAPTLVEFVNWVINQAIQAGKNRLYFLSRDGYQMYLIAKRLVEMKKVSIDCSYLHVSRYSMRIPGYHLNIEKSIDSICVGGIDVTLIKILKRGGLTEDECKKIIKEFYLEAEQNKILNYRQVMQLKEQLRTSKNLKTYIKKHSIEAYDSARGYLEQEGLCRDNKFAIVDSGWIGTLQCSIETLLQSVNPEIKVDGYYFGMYEYPPDVDTNRFHAYYFSARKGINRKASFSNSLFETIVSADEGMTIGYEKKEDKYLPIFQEQKNPNAKQMKRNVEALEMYLQELNSTVWQSERSNQELAEQLLTRFMSKPTLLECECYGNNLFSDDVLEGCYKEVAAYLTWEQIKNQRFINKILIISGLKKATIYESAWLEGSAVRAINDGDFIGTTKKEKLLSSEFKHIRTYKKFVFLRKQMKRK